MRIAIVNDLKIAVEVLKRTLCLVPGYEIAWVAYDGAEAVKKCAEDTPDIILMDLLMPVMDGVEATARIMKNSPCAILIVTASVVKNAGKVFDAMGHGALDVVKTPSLVSINSIGEAEVLLKKLEVIGRYIGKTEKYHRQRAEIRKSDKRPNRDVPELVIIGASTGGPMALLRMLSHIPPNSGLSIVVIQHVDEQFANGLSKWLAEQISLPVEIVAEGSKPKHGTVMLAGQNNHLVFSEDLELHYMPEPAELAYRPSVDVFFQSAADFWPENAVAALLTGMGTDGAIGLKTLHEKGWYTIAQHQNSCVVYGMPKAAVELGAVTDVLMLDEIAPSIIRYFNKKAAG